MACDPRGHGLSPGNPADCSIETYGADVAQMLADLDLPPAILVGHSMGCRVVLQCYRVAPDRVAGIVLVDGSRVGLGDRDVAERGMAEDLRSDRYDHFIRNFFEEMFVASSDPAVKSAIVERALELPSDVGRALLTRMVGWDAAEMESALAAVRVPMMVVQSTALSLDQGRVTLSLEESSPWLDLVQARVPDARIEILTGVGHFPQIEAADELNLLIADFASSQQGGDPKRLES